MVVTTSALESQSEKGGCKCLHPVADIFHTVFFLNTSAFGFLLMQATKRCGQNLVVGGIRQQIARNLPCNKLIEWHIFIK